METTHDIQWWLSRVDGIRKVSDGYVALCPAHSDVNPSLHITQDSNGEIVVHCFKGCKYGEILGAIEGDRIVVQTAATVTFVESPHEPASVWWSEYTGVPWTDWAKWGVEEDTQGIIFTWPSRHVVKRRRTGTKEFAWEPSGVPTPPLWPEVPDLLPEEIWLTEGESDCGILRHLGYDAYAITKGASSKLIAGVWRGLKSRGMKRVIICFDTDEAGVLGAASAAEMARAVMLRAVSVDLSSSLDALKSEKDLRDLWLRIQNEDALHRLLMDLVPCEVLEQRPSRISLNEFMTSPVPEQPWTVDQIWLDKCVGMIVGAPKMGKSWLGLDLALSIASGRDFLGTFKVSNPGPVVYIVGEDPEALLHDRLAKILTAKGFGGSVNQDENEIRLEMPPELKIPLYLDVGHDFLFSEERIADLMQWISEIHTMHGSLSLVVFDPILRMMVNVDEYKATEVGQTVFGAAEQIRRKFDTSVCLVHHKGKGSSVGKTSYGSLAFHAFSEQTLYISGDEPGDGGWIPVRGEYKSAGETSWSYRFTCLEPTYDVEASYGAGPPKSGKELAEEILRMLEKVSPEGLTSQQLVDLLHGPPDGVVREHLTSLQEEGRVYKAERQGKSPKSGGPKPHLWSFVPTT